jgi:diguanylate cyclase (GGDEF)-like protein
MPGIRPTLNLRSRILELSVLVTLIGGILSTTCFFLLNSTSAAQNKQRELVGVLDVAQAEIESNRQVRAEAVDTLNDQYIALCTSVAMLINEDPALAQKSGSDRLQDIAGKLNLEEVVVVDGMGYIVACNKPDYVGYDMRSDEQSVVFMQILSYPAYPIVQEARANGVTGAKYKYIGVARLDAPGVVQIGFAPARTENAVKYTELPYVLSTLVSSVSGNYVFAADADGVIVAAADTADTPIGQTVEIPEDGGVILLNGERRIVYSRELSMDDGTVTIAACALESAAVSRIAVNTVIFLLSSFAVFALFTMIAYHWLNGHLFKGIEKLTRLADGQEIITDDDKGLDSCKEIIDLAEGITALRKKIDGYEQSATAFDLTDKTGVSSRLCFTRSMENEWDRAVRDGSSISIIAVSADDFERFSGESADKVIQALADMLDVTAKRPADVVGRMDDNLFCVLLPVTKESGALLVAEHVLKAAGRLEIEDGNITPIGVSIGVATMIPAEGAAPAELTLRAETALERAESKGGGRINLFSAETENDI